MLAKSFLFHPNSQPQKNLPLRRQLRIYTHTIGYFKTLSAENGIPYQTLINLFLRDCAAGKKRPQLNWVPSAKRAA